MPFLSLLSLTVVFEFVHRAMAASTGSQALLSSLQHGVDKLSITYTPPQSPTTTLTSSIVDLGVAILAGLGVSHSASTSTVASNIASSTDISPTNTSSGFRSIGVSTTTSASSVAFTSAIQNNVTDCQQQLASWSTATSDIRSPYLTYSVSVSGPLTAVSGFIQGTGSVYTTSDGWARAWGNFTTTTTLFRNYTYSYVFNGTNIITTPLALANATIPPSPTCSIGPSSCTQLYSSYFASLGIFVTGADVLSTPFIWPVPSNSPRCKTGNTNYCLFSSERRGCTISGGNVQVYYWPNATPAPIISNGNRTRHPVTQVVGNVTMTSPSVYLSIDTLMARSTFVADNGICHTVGKFNLTAALPAQTQVGTTFKNLLISMPPRDVSTLDIAYSDGGQLLEFPDTALSALKGSDTSAYHHWAGQIARLYAGVIAKSMDVADLEFPGVRPYYLGPNIRSEISDFCNPFGPSDQCNTIYNDMYRAQLCEW